MTLMSTPRRLCLGGRGAAPLRDLLLPRGVDGAAGWGRGRGPPAAVSGRRANVMCEGVGGGGSGRVCRTYLFDLVPPHTARPRAGARMHAVPPPPAWSVRAAGRAPRSVKTRDLGNKGRPFE
jgi:hypothetical protein